MFKSIKFKFFLFFTIVVATILSITSFVLYKNAYQNVISNIDGSLHIILRDMLYDTIETTKEKDIEELKEDLEEIGEKFNINNLQVRVVNYDLKTKKYSTIAKSSQTNENIFSSLGFFDNLKEEETLYKTLNNYRVGMKFFKLNSSNVILIQSAIAISYRSDTLKNTLFIIIFSSFIILFAVMFGAYLLISKTLSTVNDVVKSVNQIEAYDYKKRVNTQNIPNEIKELVNTFNKLLSRHEESFLKISQFSSDASHELNTPLTIIQGELEVGLRKEREQREYQDILNNVLMEIIKIRELVSGLLFLAKTDKLQIKSNFEEVYLDEIITECVEEMQKLAIQKAIKIEITNLLPITLIGNSLLLKIACKNLLKNSITYSSENKTIKIWTKQEGEFFKVYIQDEGVGISKENLKHIFDRFYRVDKKLSNKGVGLGLSIVKMILDIHDFKINFSSKINKGTVVKITVNLNSRKLHQFD